MAGKLWSFLVLGAIGAATWCLGPTRAYGQVYDSPPPAEPGFKIVEEIEYRDQVCDKCCKAMPSTKKVTKAVYDVKCVDYCQKKCPIGYEHGCCSSCDGGNPDCVKCGKVKTKKILLKKFVTEECPSTKCEVDYKFEKVPCKVYRKVPIGEPGVEMIPPPGKKPELLAPPKEGDKAKE